MQMEFVLRAQTARLESGPHTSYPVDWPAMLMKKLNLLSPGADVFFKLAGARCMIDTDQESGNEGRNQVRAAAILSARARPPALLYLSISAASEDQKPYNSSSLNSVMFRRKI